MPTQYNLAPELYVSQWFNTDHAPTLQSLLGKVVLIEAFQMLCPGCVTHGLPLAQRVQDTFNPDQIAVIGLHTVFEHHAAQGTHAALEAFLHEYRFRFPVGIDASAEDGGHVPRTMAAYQLRGTPSLILIDRQGRLRKKAFGSVEDLALGAEIMTLIEEPVPGELTDQLMLKPESAKTQSACNEDGCPIP